MRVLCSSSPAELVACGRAGRGRSRSSDQRELKGNRVSGGAFLSDLPFRKKKKKGEKRKVALWFQREGCFLMCGQPAQADGQQRARSLRQPGSAQPTEACVGWEGPLRQPAPQHHPGTLCDGATARGDMGLLLSKGRRGHLGTSFAVYKTRVAW